MKLAIKTEDQAKPVYKNRKTFLGFLVRPKQQVRIALFFTGATWTAHLVLMAVIVPNATQLDEIQITMYLALSAVTLSLFSILSGIVLSHRLYGPLISIKRHIAHLREGQYSSRLNLRATDDLGEMRDSLNDLASALESRHGSGPRAPS